MTANKLQQAIGLIKAGDEQSGQKILLEVLNAEPSNEAAWLWMSVLVAGEKRRFCLEKVLSLNPDNRQAREQLARLAPAAPPSIQSPMPAAAEKPAPPAETLQRDEPPASEAAPPSSYAPVQGNPLPKVWLVPGKHLASVICLEGSNLLTFDVLPEKATEVVNEVRLGVTPAQFNQIKGKFHLMSINHLFLPRVNSVTLFGDSLKVTGVDKSGKVKSLSTDVNKENQEAVLKALHEELGPEFQRSVRPVSRLRVMGSALVLFVLTICGTGFLAWFAQGLKAEVEAEGRVGGSARTRGLANLLLLIGPNGFLCIGGVVLIVVLIALISSLAKPPEEIVLARAAEAVKSS